MDNEHNNETTGGLPAYKRIALRHFIPMTPTSTAQSKAQNEENFATLSSVLEFVHAWLGLLHVFLCVFLLFLEKRMSHFWVIICLRHQRAMPVTSSISFQGIFLTPNRFNL